MCAPVGTYYHEAFASLPAAPSTQPATPRRVLQPRPRTVPPHNGPATRLRSRHVAARRCVCGSRGPSSPAPLHVAVSLYPAAATWASTRRSRRLIPPRLEAALISVRSRREARRCPRSLRQRGRGRHQAAVPVRAVAPPPRRRPAPVPAPTPGGAAPPEAHQSPTEAHQRPRTRTINLWQPHFDKKWPQPAGAVRRGEDQTDGLSRLSGPAVYLRAMCGLST